MHMAAICPAAVRSMSTWSPYVTRQVASLFVIENTFAFTITGETPSHGIVNEIGPSVGADS